MSELRVGTWRPRGLVTGIGSLPHRSTRAAARLALTAGDIPAIPTLPKRSPAEGMISQALAGMRGVTIGQYGSIFVDAAAIDQFDDTAPDLGHEAYRGWRVFLDEARQARLSGPVKWQFVGPVTLGIALVRAGVPSSLAFGVAVRVVRTHVDALLDHVADVLPVCQQIVFIDEPSFADVGTDELDVAPDAAIDMVSAALARVEQRATVGLHCCAAPDLAALLATGPHVLSIPLGPMSDHHAGHLIRFIDRGGVVAWGAVPTSGPVPGSADRLWKRLCAAWCQLVERGADPRRLRHQALITPECGLGMHTPAGAEQVFAIARQLGARVREQSSAAQFAFGA